MTKIYAASFCTNWGERIVLHISRHSDKISPERALLQEILFYLDQFPLTFGWYTTGVAVYDEKGNRIRGRGEDAKKIALETYRILDTISKIKEFMFTDLDKTLELVNTPKGAPNFMLALVLCCYTEFWGKLMVPSGDPKTCFDSFFCKLGSKYKEVMKAPNMSVYGRIRSGLAHSYLVKGNARILIEGGDCGVNFETESDTYTIYVRRYLDDFKIAVNKFVAEIGLDIKKYNDAKKVVKGEFQLI